MKRRAALWVVSMILSTAAASADAEDQETTRRLSICGPRSVQRVLEHLGQQEDLASLVTEMQGGVVDELSSLHDIQEALSKRGIYSLPLKLGFWGSRIGGSRSFCITQRDTSSSSMKRKEVLRRFATAFYANPVGVYSQRHASPKRRCVVDLPLRSTSTKFRSFGGRASQQALGCVMLGGVALLLRHRSVRMFKTVLFRSGESPHEIVQK